MLMEDELINIDLNKLNEYDEYYTKELDRVTKELYSIYGSEFKIGSTKEKDQVFKILGINTEEVNVRGELKTDKQHIEKALLKYKEDTPQYKFLNDLLLYSSLNKQKTAFIDSYKDMLSNSKNGNKLRFSYKTVVVPSGRFSAGGDKNNDYFAKANIQQISKPSPQNYYCINIKDAERCNIDISLYENEHQECYINGSYSYKIMDWLFKETPFDLQYNKDEPNQWVCEGFNQELNMRSLFYPNKDKYFVSCDYSSQELRLLTLLSKDEDWTKILCNNGDLHKQVAIKMWGEDNYDKSKRKKAKSINFGILYGMTARNFAEQFGISVQEAENMVEQYKKAVPGIMKWIHDNEQGFIKNGTGYTYWGRPRRLKYWLDKKNIDRGLYSFGIRSCTNTVIQGSAADVTKIALLRLYNCFFKDNKNVNRKYIRFLNMIHDEINFEVSKDDVEYIVPKILNCMTLWEDEWAFPMKVGLSISTRWGNEIEFEYDDRLYVPITERPIDLNEDRYTELSYEESSEKGLIGKNRFVKDPNGNLIKNKKYLNILHPIGEIYIPQNNDEIEQRLKELDEDYSFTIIDGEEIGKE